MDEKQLKALRIVEIDETRKEQDYLHVQQKLRKHKRLNWRVPAVVLAACAIFFIIWLTAPPGQQEQAADGGAQVAKIYVTEQEYVPKSGWIMDVTTISNEEMLVRYGELLNVMKPISPPTQYETRLMLRFKLTDGTARDFEYRWANHQLDYLYETATGKSYELESLEPVNSSKFGALYWDMIIGPLESISKVITFVLLIALYIFRWYVEKNMIKETGSTSKLPMDSSIWQSISRIVAWMLAALLLFTIEGLHFGVVLAVFFVKLLVLIVIERAGEKNQWRQKNFIFHFFISILLTYLLLYPLIR